MTRTRTYVALFVIGTVSALAIPMIDTLSASTSHAVNEPADGGPTQVTAGLAAIKPSAMTPSEVWTRQFGTSDVEEANAIAVDSGGNSYVAGMTNGTLPGQTSAGADDAFVRKYDAGGNIVWTRQFGTSANDEAWAIALDAASNSYVTGVAGTFPGQPSSGAFVRKYDAEGNQIWTRQFGATGADKAYGVAVDETGNIYVAGQTVGTLPGQTSSGLTDVFVRKYDTAGNIIWTRQFGTSQSDVAFGIALDAAGNSYTAGITQLTLPGQTSSGGHDAFVRKYDAAGTEVWTRQFGSNTEDSAQGVAVDSTGNSYVAGWTMGAFPGQTSSGVDDAFVRKYDAAGNELWTRQFGTSDFDRADGIATDAAGNIFIAGGTDGTFPGQTTSGRHDAFVRKYDAAGTEVWTRQFGSSSVEAAKSIAWDAAGHSYVTGVTDGTLPGQTSSGDRDAFVRKYSEGAPSPTATPTPSPSPSPSPQPASVQFSSNAYIGNESRSIIITLTRTGDLSGTSRVMISSSGGTGIGGASCSIGADYVDVSEVVTFAPTVVSQTVDVDVCPDNEVEPFETINLTLSEPTGTLIGAPSSAVVTINDTANQFNNMTPIVINSGAAAAPYPSVINVSGATTNAYRIRVTLYNLWHDIPENVQVLLVGPNGAEYVLMAATGGPFAIDPDSPVTLTFWDQNPSEMPDEEILLTGAYRPTTCATPVTNFPPPAPAGSYIEPGCTYQRPLDQTIYGIFGGQDANGDWSLYVSDVSTGSPMGIVAGGWGIEILEASAFGVGISGQVTTRDGRGIRSATVSIIDYLGHRRSVVTSPLGYYSFNDVEAGATIDIVVTSKRYRFLLRRKQAFETVSDEDFEGLE